MLAIPTPEAIRAEGLITSQDSEVFDFVATVVAAVCAVVAYERSVAEQEEIGVGVEESAAGVAAEAVDVPSVASCGLLACVREGECL